MSAYPAKALWVVLRKKEKKPPVTLKAVFFKGWVGEGVGVLCLCLSLYFGKKRKKK